MGRRVGLLVAAVLALAAAGPAAADEPAPVSLPAQVHRYGGGVVAAVDVTSECRADDEGGYALWALLLTQVTRRGVERGGGYVQVSPCPGGPFPQRLLVMSDAFGVWEPGPALLQVHDQTTGAQWYRTVELLAGSGPPVGTPQRRIVRAARLVAQGLQAEVALQVRCRRGTRADVTVGLRQPGDLLPVWGRGSRRVRCAGGWQRVVVTATSDDNPWRAGPAFVISDEAHRTVTMVSGP